MNTQFNITVILFALLGMLQSGCAHEEEQPEDIYFYTIWSPTEGEAEIVSTWHAQDIQVSLGGYGTAAVSATLSEAPQSISGIVDSDPGVTLSVVIKGLSTECAWDADDWPPEGAQRTNNIVSECPGDYCYQSKTGEYCMAIQQRFPMTIRPNNTVSVNFPFNAATGSNVLFGNPNNFQYFEISIVKEGPGTVLFERIYM